MLPILGKRQERKRETAQDSPGEFKIHKMMIDPCWMEGDRKSKDEMGVLGGSENTSRLTASEKKKDAWEQWREKGYHGKRKWKALRECNRKWHIQQGTEVSQRLNGTEHWHWSRKRRDKESNLNNDLAFQESVMVLNMCRIFCRKWQAGKESEG